MENFAKKIVQNKPVIRKIHILKTLSESDKTISSNLLANQLNCTNRTIINDISQIKQELPINWEIISVASKGYLLKKNPEDTIKKIITPYLINSEIYTILKGLFNNKCYKLEKWAQLLYVDKLTLKKILQEFTKTIQHFKMNFNFRTLNLIGEELNIRYFYIIFFYTIQKYKEIINIHPYLQKKIEILLVTHEIELDLNLLTIIISVFVNRNINNHFITKKHHFRFQCSQNKFKCGKSIILEIEEFYKIKFPKEEQEFFLQSLFLISEGTGEEKTNVINYFCKFKKNMYNSYLSLLENISSLFHLDLHVKRQLQHDVYFQLYKLYTLKKYNLSIEYLIDEYKDLYESNPEFTNTYNIISTLIAACNKKLLEHTLNKDELYYITVNILFHVHSNLQKKNALLLLSGPISWKKFIYNKLNNALGNVLIIHPKCNNITKYEFIITNYNVTNVTKPVIQISDKITQRDIENIKKWTYVNSAMYQESTV